MGTTGTVKSRHPVVLREAPALAAGVSGGHKGQSSTMIVQEVRLVEARKPRQQAVAHGAPNRGAGVAAQR